MSEIVRMRVIEKKVRKGLDVRRQLFWDMCGRKSVTWAQFRESFKVFAALASVWGISRLLTIFTFRHSAIQWLTTSNSSNNQPSISHYYPFKSPYQYFPSIIPRTLKTIKIHSPATLSVAFLLRTLPSSFRASQKYTPASLFRFECTTIRKNKSPVGRSIKCPGSVVIRWPSLYHSIVGDGKPSALHLNVTGSCFGTTASIGCSMIFGGSSAEMRKAVLMNLNMKKFFASVPGSQRKYFYCLCSEWKIHKFSKGLRRNGNKNKHEIFFLFFKLCDVL